MSGGAVLGYFWGDDGYGLERAADRLAERLAEAGGMPPERRRVTGAGTTPEQLGELVTTAPLFGSGTMVTVVEPMPLVRYKLGQEAMATVIANVAPGNGLVFLDPLDGSRGDKGPPEREDRGPSGRGEGRAKSKEGPAWRGVLRDTVLAAGGETKHLPAPKQGQLAAWIEARAVERGLRLERGAAQELATRVGGFVGEGDVDRTRMGMLAIGELEKLGLFRPDGPIGRDDVRALVAEAVPASSWAFLDAVGNRQLRTAAELLPRILDTLPEPVLVTQLHRRLRELILVADLLASGARPASLARTLGLHPYRVDRLVEQARRWTLPELQAALEGVFELDLRSKGVEATTSGAQWRLAVTLWVVDLVGPPPAAGAGEASRVAGMPVAR